MITANEAAKLTKSYHKSIEARAAFMLPEVMRDVDSLIVLLAYNGEGELLYDLKNYARKTNTDINEDLAREITDRLADELCSPEMGFRVTRETYCSLHIVWYKMN